MHINCYGQAVALNIKRLLVQEFSHSICVKYIICMSLIICSAQFRLTLSIKALFSFIPVQFVLHCMYTTVGVPN